MLELFKKNQHHVDVEGDDYVLLPVWELQSKKSLSKNEIMDEMGIIIRPVKRAPNRKL